MKTNKYIIKFALFIMSALFVTTMCSCSDDDTLKESIIDEKFAGEILTSVVTEWGISLQQVTQRMNNYELVTTQNDDFLMFTNRRNTCYISYKFQDDSLYCALVLMSKMTENVNLGDILKGYSFLGEIGGSNIYQNNGDNVLICANEAEEDGTMYQAVGFTPISSEMSPFVVPTEGITAGHEWVDLGLNVKWATCNVGAESPEVYGGYYAWGETEEKTIYDWSTYKWCNGSYDTQMKYCTSSSYGTVDDKTVLDPEDDAAAANWGSPWRMPTRSEIEELIDNCIWSWTIQNGVNGYKVTGPNGNSIFLPAAGYRYGTEVKYRGSYGYYWSGTLREHLHYRAYHLFFRSGDHDWSGNDRDYGYTVRPVTE